MNALEQGVPFAILVLILDRIDGFTDLTAWTCVAFVVLRIAHAVGYITAWARFPLRPILFTLGWLCCIVLGWAIFTA